MHASCLLPFAYNCGEVYCFESSVAFLGEREPSSYRLLMALARFPGGSDPEAIAGIVGVDLQTATDGGFAKLVQQYLAFLQDSRYQMRKYAIAYLLGNDKRGGINGGIVRTNVIKNVGRAPRNPTQPNGSISILKKTNNLTLFGNGEWGIGNGKRYWFLAFLLFLQRFDAPKFNGGRG